MRIKKSSRHSKIIGDFGEHMICNWLSRSGFEVTLVDHTGIDVLAYNPPTKERIGITVKSRTRPKGKEQNEVNLFSRRKKKDPRKKLREACKAFECEPWIGVYVETTKYADFYLTSLKNYDKKYRGKKGKVVEGWKMKKKNIEEYEKDPAVKHIHIDFDLASWVFSK